MERIDVDALCREQAGLTEGRMRVLRVLAGTSKPLKAYAILEELRSRDPNVAPVQVYRALDHLRSIGLVVRLASINAFTVRQRSSSKLFIYLVCDACANVNVVQPGIEASMAGLIISNGFTPATPSLEVVGVCADCRERGATRLTSRRRAAPMSESGRA